ncbi:hypothetical protein CGRA01v4_05567 [Colletotrichum graminicola]|nr:hypothetical protein CGRA01v4_05567 [Colletotrichum graminicola]
MEFVGSTLTALLFIPLVFGTILLPRVLKEDYRLVDSSAYMR